MPKIHVTQIRSGIGRMQFQKDTLKALGLKRIRHTVVHKDSPHIRGMINTVNHLIKWELKND